MRGRPFFVGVSVLLAVSLVACKKPAPPTMPPPEVTVATVAAATIEDNLDFSGDVQAYRTVEVRAQAAGVILERRFTEGAQVRAGDVLYRIDPTNTDADLRGARARLAESQARLSNAETNAARLRPLLQGNAVARQDVDNAETQVAQARAAVDDARAAVDRARKGADETVVRAAIAGRVGRTELDVGARVTGPADVLTNIDVLDPIYVNFRPSSQQQMAWRRNAQVWRALQSGGAARIEAVLPDGTPFPEAGRIGFIDPVVDPRTGTQQYRAQFANKSHLLVPGQFVRVRVRGLQRENAIVVPQRAVLQQMGRQIVYVVGSGDSVAAREVKATVWSNNDAWLIENGLATGDRVIIDGVQKVAPGRVVRPTPAGDSVAKAAVGPAGTKASGAAK